ncbi:AAA family ATPase [Candidatus Saganbacteria bacterium]|nr:AAA family ATPase [Candidatus Saganbacteria bacterium]
MYLEHWKLTEKPFENTPDPRFIFWSKRHEEALSRMFYVIKEKKGAALISGEYGSGKTLLTRVLVEKLGEDEYETALLLNPMLSPAQLIKEIIHQLGGEVPSSANKAVSFNRLNEVLLGINRQRKHAVIIIDEAQAIARTASLEEFRLMLNFQLNDRFLLTLILIGQPELNEKIKKLPQLEQRFALRYHLTALDEYETGEYIRHRLSVAGGSSDLFEEEAVAEIYRFTQGIPRKINNFCDLALLLGSGEEAISIDLPLIKKVLADYKEEGA